MSVDINSLPSLQSCPGMSFSPYLPCQLGRSCAVAGPQELKADENGSEQQKALAQLSTAFATKSVRHFPIL